MFAIVDISGFSFTTLKMEYEKEKTISQLVLDATREPLLQGSFIEAKRRLQQFKREGTVLCAKMEVWEISTNLCESPNKQTLLEGKVEKDILLASTDKTSAGKLTLYFDRSRVLNGIISRLLFSAFLLCVGALVLSLLLLRLGRRIQAELAEVLRLIESPDSQARSPLESKGEGITVREFAMIAEQLKEVFRLKTQVFSHQAMAQMAMQVSHDIRSPLTALNILVADPEAVSNKHKPLIRSAIDRIRDIADGALAHHRLRHVEIEKKVPKEVLSVNKLLRSVKEVITEQGIQHSSRARLAFKTELPDEEIEVLAEETDLKRILSNLIVNSVDAVEKMGEIQIKLCKGAKGWIELHISDNGHGMPKEVLEQLGERGFTFGKENGNGLGVWYAKRVIDSWGGKLKVNSEPNLGTTVTVFFAVPNQQA